MKDDDTSPPVAATAAAGGGPKLRAEAPATGVRFDPDERRRLEQEVANLRQRLQDQRLKEKRRRKERHAERRRRWFRFFGSSGAGGGEKKTRVQEKSGESTPGRAGRRDAEAVSPWRLLESRGLLHRRTGSPPPSATGKFGTPGLKKIVLAAHRASRTGAPLVLLHLMKAMARTPGVELYLFLGAGGPLVEEFARLAHVVANEKQILFSRADLSVPRLLDELEEPRSQVALCNSAETWRFMDQLRGEGNMARLALIDESLNHYPPDVHAIILDYADAIVFPSEAMREVGRRIDPRFGASRVIPHGLMRPEFGRGDRDGARKAVRQELGIPPESRVVLACGVIDQRKGADLFSRLAERVLKTHAQDVHFVWVGESQDTGAARDQRMWIGHDLEQLKLKDRVHFIGAREDAEPWFAGADVFVLPSREDAFPCVVHEAMAAALPIIAFADGGGAPEALAGGCGICVPYLNVEAMAEAVAGLLEEPERGREIGRRAEERVRTRLRFDTFAEQIMRLCEETERRR